MRAVLFIAIGVVAVGCQEAGEEGRAVAPATQVEYRGVITQPDVIAGIELPTVRGGPAMGVRTDELQPVALVYNTMFTGVTLARNGRTFFSFPRWTDRVSFTVGELREGQLWPYPSAERNYFDREEPGRVDAREQLVSVQSVVMDERGRLWALDTGNINFQGVIAGGPKLVGYDLGSGKVARTIRFAEPVVRPKSYLNDVRFDLRRGDGGMAFITDSGEGAIVVVDLASGESWRRLEGHASVEAVPGFVPLVENGPMRRSVAGEAARPIDIAADGIALSPDGKTLYYSPLSGRTVYSVSVEALADRSQTEEQVARTVKTVAEKPSANDGMICDGQGRIYTTDFEDNSIRRIDPGTGKVEMIAQDERLLWPDSLWIHGGYLYVTANQLNRMSTYHNGEDLRRQPYVLFRVELK